MDRYWKTKTYIDDSVSKGRKRYGLWECPDFTKLPELELTDDTFFTYRIADTDLGRIDLLAYKFYGDVSLWWVICVVNKIANPLTDMWVGQELKILDKDYVAKLIRV